MARRGLYSNIHAKRKRIAAGSGEKMRKVGQKGAPAKGIFKKIANKIKKKKQRKDNNMPGYGYGKMSKKMTKKPMKKKVRIVMGNKNTKSKKRKA